MEKRIMSSRTFGLIISLALFSSVSHAVVLYDNFSMPDPDGGTVVNNSQFPANKIIAGAESAVITSFVAKMNFSTPGPGLTADICPDNGSGTGPGIPCSTFTPASLPTDGKIYEDIAFAGSFLLAANSTYWVILKSTSTGEYRWQQSIALIPGTGYLSSNSGANYNRSSAGGSDYFSYYMQVLGDYIQPGGPANHHCRFFGSCGHH